MKMIPICSALALLLLFPSPVEAATEAQLRAADSGQDAAQRADKAAQHSLSAGAVNRERVKRARDDQFKRIESNRLETKARVKARSPETSDPRADADTPTERRRKKLEAQKARKIEAMRATQAAAATAELEEEREEAVILDERRRALKRDSSEQEPTAAIKRDEADPRGRAPGKTSDAAADQPPAAKKRWWQFWR